MSPATTLIDKLAAAWPSDRWRDVTVLVAVSGGADSVALARALHRLHKRGEGRLVLAHFNHRLRGVESDGDQAFVEQLGLELGVECVVGASAGVGTTEESLRDARYAFLRSAAHAAGARYVATAHTADDQVETVLHNLVRGTGLAGLAGIPRVRRLTGAASLVRPLLDVTRGEVVAYLAGLGQTYRSDATNEQLDFTRNRIRHTLLPLLEREFNPKVREAILRLSQIAAEADSFLDEQAEALLIETARAVPGCVALDAAALAAAHPALARHALVQLWTRQHWPLQDMSYGKWEQLRLLAAGDSLAAGTLKHTLPGGVQAEREGNLLRLTPPA
jgi:tRNA(Ile)-lysidine synthase